MIIEKRAGRVTSDWHIHTREIITFMHSFGFENLSA